MGLVPLPQVVREVLLDVLDEAVRVFGVEVQDLVQAPQVDTLEVAVGQGFHVGVGLDHSVVQGQVGTDQVALTCSQEETTGTR